MRMPRRFVFSGAVALGFFGACISGEVRAQDMPCTEEIRTFCADVQPGGGRILQCLKNNEAKLSPACTARVNDLQGAVSGPLGACRDDWAAYCYHPRASTSRQAMIQCLQANQAKVSAGCQKALREVTGTRRERTGEKMP
jgi:Cysteine rich repeat